MKNKTVVVILLAYLFRIIISLTSYHQDIGAIAMASKYILVNHQYTNFYDNSEKSANKTIFNYQPLAYLLPAFIYSPFTSIVKNSADLLENRDWINHQKIAYSPLLLFYKLPALFADLIILLLLPLLFKDQKSKNLSQIAWSLNPIAIYVSSVMGQVDIIISLFILLSFILVKKNKLNLAVIAIGISALIKPIGLILIPLLALKKLRDENLISAIKTFSLGVATYILGIIPFIYSSSYRHYALFAEQINKSLYAGIQISAGTAVPLFFISLILFYLYYYQGKVVFAKAFSGILLSSLVFTHFHPQWLVWVVPILTYITIKSKTIYSYVFIVIAWFVVLISFDNTMLFGAFLKPFLLLTDSFRESGNFKLIEMLSRGYLVAFLLWSSSKSITLKERAN